MFPSLGRFAAHHARLLVVVWVVLAATGCVLASAHLAGSNLSERLAADGWSVTGSESAEGSKILQDNAAAGEEITLLIKGLDATTADAQTLSVARSELGLLPGVEAVFDPQALAAGPAPEAAANLVADEGTGFLVVVDLRTSLDEQAHRSTVLAVAARLDDLGRRLTTGVSGASATVGSPTLISESIRHQAQRDMVTGGLIAIPLVLAALVLILGGFRAALLPIAASVMATAVTLGALWALASLLDLQAADATVAVMMGLGLSLGFGAWLVARFQVELRRRHRAEPVLAAAVTRAVSGSGPTAVLAAITIVVPMAGLLLLRPTPLPSLGLAGICAAVISIVSALTLVPALVLIAGRHVRPAAWTTRLPWARHTATEAIQPPSKGPDPARWAGRLGRRPRWVLAGSVVLLAALALPAFGIHLRISHVESLPESAKQRQFLSQLAEQYPSASSSDMQVIAATTLEDVPALRTRIGSLPGVAAVAAPVALGSYSVLGIDLTTSDAGGSAAESTVRDVRALDLGVRTWVTGQAAEQVDFTDALHGPLWWAAALVLLVTVLLLFLLTGSIVAPLRAVLTAGLTVAAALGILTSVTRQGYFAPAWGPGAGGGVESTAVVAVIAFGFGLALSCEVVRASPARTAGSRSDQDATAAAPAGSRVARLASAAGTIAVGLVCAGFAISHLLSSRQVGAGLVVVIAVDVVIVRLFLVPATRALAGRWDQWAPGPVRRLHSRARIPVKRGGHVRRPG